MEYQNIYDLDDKINLIYDYFYNKDTNNIYSIDKITIGKISIDDIKLSLNNSEDKNEIDNYNKNKNDILNGKFKIVNNNNNNNFIYKRYSDQLSLLLKINFYTTENEINSLESEINNDSLFSYILSYLVLNKNTKHILLPIINFDINFEDIKKLIFDDLIHQNIKELINNNNYSNICCLQLRENFFKMQNLEEFISESNNNKFNYKALIFQVIHTLAVIQNEFPNFCHNNLILKNIYIYCKKKQSDFNLYEGFNNDKFCIQNLNFDIKISNFEKSYIPKYYGLFNIKSNKINPYYDLYIFLSDLIKFANDKDKELTNFFDLYLPKKIRNNYDNSIIIKPIDLLYDKFFKDYKINSEKFENNTLDHNYITNLNEYKHIHLKTKFNDTNNEKYLGQQSTVLTTYIKNKRIINSISDDNILIRKQIFTLVGGGDKIESTPYKVEKNTPFISNEQRKINEIRTKENPPKEPPILLEQKLYDTSQKSQPKSQFPPTFIPLYDQDGSVANQLLPYSNIVNQPPLQKVYNISLSNPLGNYSTINKIYEDVIPGNPQNFSYLTTFERCQLIDFLRNNILDSNDGEEMTISGGKNSLLSYIKILDVNPYSVEKNPYMDLPKNFLLYRAAYPVRFENKSNSIGLGKPSMGVNIRIYMMTYGDLNCKKINFIDSENFDLWREIQYYDTVKNIIKRKISPNFISPILYKIDSESKIDWNQLEIIKSKATNNYINIELKKNQKKINDIHKLKKNFGLLSKFLPFQLREDNDKQINEIKIKIENDVEDITINSGKILILLTEAPTSNIIQWSSAIYESFGTVKKMISTGYHTPDIWKSIIFQLVYACAVLQENIILIENLSLENNVYIKDIYSDPNSVGSWIYKINNIEYYIPNYGYILVIDSKYTDINIDNNLINKNKAELQKFKLYGKLFKNNSIYDNIKIEDLKPIIKEQFLNLINPDNFSHKLKLKGGSKPDDSILDLLKNMWSDTDCINIRDYILKYFRDFLHNRLGTLLYKSEKDNLNLFYRPNFNNYKGKLLVYQKRYQEFEWIIYLNDNHDQIRKDIIRLEGNEYIIDAVFPNTLFNYPDNEIILPETKKSMKYDEANIFEIYNLDNIT
jgi:hypothetical protein